MNYDDAITCNIIYINVECRKPYPKTLYLYTKYTQKYLIYNLHTKNQHKHIANPNTQIHHSHILYHILYQPDFYVFALVFVCIKATTN